MTHTKFDDYKGTAPIIIGVLIILYLLFFRNDKYIENPRLKNGIHYIQSKDSVYKLRFEIDSVFPIEYEPEDRN